MNGDSPGDRYEALPDDALPSYAQAYPSPRRRGAAATSWPALLAAAALAALALTALLRASLARAGAPGEAWDGHSLPLDLALAARAAGTTEDALRAEAVRRAMRHAWHGYEAHAWGADELRPASRTGKSGVTGGMDGFSGLGASIVDAMSTLHVMGLMEEFERAHAWVAENMTFDPPHGQVQHISFFETTIRLVGGLMAAHDLSGARLFLDLAADLGGRLLPVFEGGRPGVLTNTAQLPRTRAEPARTQYVLLAELGTNLVELGALAARTGNETFRRRAEDGLRFLHAKHPDNPLLGVSIDRRTGDIGDAMHTVGAPADSYFEYLLKYWILRGRADDHWRARWVNSTDAALAELAVRPRGVPWAFVGERADARSPPAPVISHLGCFWPGSLALGVISGAVEGAKADEYLEFAESMMQACFQLYNATATGLAADQASVDINTGAVTPTHVAYMQRPEVVESLFYLWRATHAPRYREWGWRILTALERHCREEAGYSGLVDATAASPDPDDVQQSWFLAETLKYLFLLFSDDSVLPLDAWVFNTEAHPVRAAARGAPPPLVDWSWAGEEAGAEMGAGAADAAAAAR